MIKRFSEYQIYGIKCKEVSKKFKKHVNKTRDDNCRYCYTAGKTYNPK